MIGLASLVKGDANDWLDEQRGQAVRGTWIDPRGGKTLFGPYARQWSGDRLHLRESTTTREARNLHNHVLPAFENRQLRAISRRLVQAWVTSLSAEGLAPSTVAMVYALLCKIMRSAVIDDRLIPESPCRTINLPEAPDDEVTIPLVAHLDLVESRLPARYRRAVSVASGSGLRQGELFGLTIDRIDFLRGTVRVDRQLQRLPKLQAEFDRDGRLPKGVKAVPLGAGMFLVEPKTKRSNREVPAGRYVLEVLAAHLAEFPPSMCDRSGTGLVFTTATGRPVTVSVFEDAWERATRRRLVSDPELPDPDEHRGARDAALEPYWTIHDERHFFASGLIAKGLAVPAVAKILGHSEEECLRTYAHLWPDDLDRARDAADQFLSAEPDRVTARDGRRRADAQP